MPWPRRVVALDFETSGLSSQYDYILQVGLAIMEGGEVVDEPFYTRVQPNLAKFKISGDALAAQLGDIFTEDGMGKLATFMMALRDAPSSREVAQSLASWSERTGAWKFPVVAHNASFDCAFFSQWKFQQSSVLRPSPLSAVWIDTITMMERAFPGGQSYNLDTCLLLAGLPSRPADHDALQDALLAGRLYAHLVEALEPKEALRA